MGAELEAAPHQAPLWAMTWAHGHQWFQSRSLVAMIKCGGAKGERASERRSCMSTASVCARARCTVMHMWFAIVLRPHSLCISNS